MTKISDEYNVVVVADDIVSCDLEGEAAILNLKNGTYYGLDPIGAQIWSLIQKPTSIIDIIDIIFKEYNVEKDQCKTDILKLIDDLLNNGLVKINE